MLRGKCSEQERNTKWTEDPSRSPRATLLDQARAQGHPCPLQWRLGIAVETVAIVQNTVSAEFQVFLVLDLLRHLLHHLTCTRTALPWSMDETTTVAAEVEDYAMIALVRIPHPTIVPGQATVRGSTAGNRTEATTTTAREVLRAAMGEVKAVYARAGGIEGKERGPGPGVDHLADAGDENVILIDGGDIAVAAVAAAVAATAVGVAEVHLPSETMTRLVRPAKTRRATSLAGKIITRMSGAQTHPLVVVSHATVGNGVTVAVVAEEGRKRTGGVLLGVGAAAAAVRAVFVGVRMDPVVHWHSLSFE